MAAAGAGKVVCVTGAGGFIASWLVKVLLSEGYTVRGTVRDPSDEKNAHLKTMENATENLQLLKSDLLDYDSLSAAISGSQGVFHIASSLPNRAMTDPKNELVVPAVDGTLNVLKACSAAKVGRVVLLSSTAAVFGNPDRPKDKIVDENCWSDQEFFKNTGRWYGYAKTAAEEKAFEYATEAELDLISVIPCLVVGPMLQPKVNFTSFEFLQVLKGLPTVFEISFLQHFVDVRDVAEALVLVYQKPEATGRYICHSCTIDPHMLLEKLRNVCPKSDLSLLSAIEQAEVIDCRLSSEKLKKLGWRGRTLEESIMDTVQNYTKMGLLDTD